VRFASLLVVVALIGCADPSGRTATTPPTELQKRLHKQDLASILNTPAKHSDIESADFPYNKPLSQAIGSGQNDVVVALIQRGAEVRTIEDGDGPLNMAIYQGNLEAVKILLRHGAGVKRLGFGMFPIHVAAQSGNVEVIEQLVRAGADPNTISPIDGTTPLDLAIEKGNKAAAIVLLKAGARPEVETRVPAHGLTTELKVSTVNRRFNQSEYLAEHPEFKPKRHR
jgi:uncharacterized protein